MADDLLRERRIVVAVDESDQSAYALSWCLDNLVSDSEDANSRDTLILVYARPPRTVDNALDGAKYLVSMDLVDSMEKYSQELAVSVMEKATAVCKGLNHGSLRECE